MADEDTKEKKYDLGAEKSDKKASGGGLLQWIIMAVVVAIFSASGFILGRLFAGSGTPETAESSEQDKPNQLAELKANDSSPNHWYYDLEPVVAFLDEPGATRYIRAALTLKINPEVDQNKGTKFLDEKKPILINWLSVYLSSLTIRDITGEKNQKRIQSQIYDAFNERLFPDAKHQIDGILFKEFLPQ